MDSPSPTAILRIAGWNQHFENNRTRELKALAWVPIPNKMDGDGYTQLVDHPDGAAHFGAWIAIVEIASRCDPRGTLLRECRRQVPATSQDGAGLQIGHDSVSLSRISRISEQIFRDAIPRLIEIGWLELLNHCGQVLTSIPQEGATIPQEGASSRVRAGARAEWNGMEWKEGNCAASAALPRTRRKRSGTDPPKPREPDPIWDGVCQVFALNPQTPSEKTRVGRIVRDLKVKSATAEEIEVRYARYCSEWPAAVASPEAVLKHWDYFAVEHQRAAADQNPARYRSGDDQYAELTRRSIAAAKAAEAQRLAGESPRPAANPGGSLADT